MKNLIIFLAALLVSVSLSGQWKAQKGETYDKAFRIAYVTSRSGKETLRVLRNIPFEAGQKTANPYDQISGQILLNNPPDKGTTVKSLVFRFDDSQKIYIHQPSDFKQGWDTGSRKYIIESDWKLWRIDDLRNKGSRAAVPDIEALPADKKATAKDIIQMLKTQKKLSCQVILINSVYGTQSVIDAEFSLINSTKSINFLFQ